MTGLLAYSSTKQSIQMRESKRPTRKDDPMDVDALSKGSGKGKSKGKGKKGGRPEAHERRQVLELRQGRVIMAVTAVRCGGQETKERARTRAKAQGRGRGKLNNAENSNLQEGWSETGAQGDEHADGWDLEW